MITYSETCYIICPSGEHDCEAAFGLLFWMLIVFLFVMICAVIASICSKCKQRRMARAAVRRNLAEGGGNNNPHANSIILGEAIVYDGAAGQN